jgi:DNA-binding MarR family transcriptional regulator
VQKDRWKEDEHEEPLGFALGAAARKLAKFYVQALADYALTPSQLFLLRQLWLEDGLPQRDLALRAQLDATSTTWLVDQLERGQLVERKRNDSDRRIVRVWLTEEGRRAQANLLPALAQWERGLYQELLSYHTADEIAAFHRVLVTLNDVLPEGDDLWKQLSDAWDSKLDRLRSLIESTETPNPAEKKAEDEKG